MNISIELTNGECDALLAMNGYITEEITAYYYANTDPYNEVNNPNDLRGVNIKIAYHKEFRPKVLEKEHPMLNVVKEYAYGEVINRLYNERLSKLIFKYF